MELIKKEMTRDEMFEKYPNKFLVVINEENGIGKLNSESGKKRGFVLAAYNTRAAAAYHPELRGEIPEEGYSIFWSEDYTEEVFNLGTLIIAG